MEVVIRRCTGCKVEKPIDQFHTAKHGRDGYNYRCKECINAYCTRRRQINPLARQSELRRTKAWIRTLAGRYSKYRRGALFRKYEWNLSFEDFSLFWQVACFYCGEPIETIGLDRVDNSKGYAVDNVVSCCEPCNKMKMSMTQEQFLVRCAKITEQHTMEVFP